MQTQATHTISDYDYQQAISKINDARTRISRHMAFAHAGEHANDLSIINAMLTHAFESLREHESLFQFETTEQAIDYLDARDERNLRATR